MAKTTRRNISLSAPARRKGRKAIQHFRDACSVINSESSYLGEYKDGSRRQSLSWMVLSAPLCGMSGPTCLSACLRALNRDCLADMSQMILIVTP